MADDDIDESLKKKWIEVLNSCNYELINDLTKLLETEQNISHILKYQVKFYFVIGEYEQALRDLTKLLDSDPNNEFALKYQGETYFMMEKYEEYFASLKKLSEINSSNKWVIKALDENSRK